MSIDCIDQFFFAIIEYIRNSFKFMNKSFRKFICFIFFLHYIYRNRL